MARAYRERKARLSGPDSVHSSLTLEPTTMRGLEHHLDGSSTACTADLLDPVPSETSPVTKVEESRGPFCACCKIRKSTSDMTSWDGSIEDLSQASSLGCVRCSLLAQVISRFTCGVDHKRSRFKVWTMSDLVELSLQPAGGDYGDSRSMALDVFIGEEPNITIFQDFRKRPVLPGCTSSEETFQTIKSWIAECDANHRACANVATGQAQLPDRILDLRDDRVAVRQNLEIIAPYACLSHCWGPRDEVLQTRQRDMINFTHSIPFHELSRNFQDAVDICRRLHIDFLWIDSLCIIQDSKQDLEDQLANMASIYENAYITIAATRAQGTKDGCYTTTEPNFVATEVVGTGLLVRQRPPMYPTLWSQPTAKEWPLLTRGWIYQEMRLSRRVVHFCQQEVIWECQDRRYSESGRSDVRLDDQFRFRHSSYEYLPHRLLTDDPVRLWYRTVQDYSRLNLTFDEDKLPALFALTQKMQLMRSNKRFLAGLWEDSLVLDLLWKVWPSPEMDRPANVRGPTWSWLAVQTQVMWEGSIVAESILSNVEVLDVRYVTSGPELAPVIHEATITLRAPSLRALIRNLHELDLATGSPEGLAVDEMQEDYAFLLPGTHQIPIGTEVFILPLAYTNMNWWHAGLVLRKLQAANRYQRIGFVKIRHADAEELRRAMEARPAQTHEQENQYEETRDRLRDQVTSMLTNLPCQEFELV